MHEASIAKGILETAAAALPRPGARITRITVVAGVLTGVQTESLELYFAELSKGTVAQGAALHVKRPPARLVCTECKNQTPYENDGDLAVRCARCGGNNRLEGGEELFIESMEIEEP
jgi:hydrogenase nickel incorporation protein HypA/HybF